MNKTSWSHQRRGWCSAVVLAAMALLHACGGGGGSSADTMNTQTPMAVVRVSLTDAPSCGFDAVNVTVQKVRIHQDGAAADSDGGWSEVIVTPTQRINLLSLTNGVLMELGHAAVPAGTYRQIRLVLAENSIGAPLANSVVPTGGTEVALDTPSAQQSGLKLQTNLTVEAGTVADFVLDFDACKSVVPRGRSGQFNLKPVIAVLPAISAAGLKVQGFVAPVLASSTTHVSLQSGGVVVRSTVPGATGQFVLAPVLEGTYDLVVSAPGRVTAVMTGVPVTSAAVTDVNSASVPIDPPASAMHTLSGIATIAGSSTIPDATVRALQSLSSGPTVELAALPVNASTGAYSFSLPASAPVKTAYVPNPASLGFSADAAVAGKYTVEAVAPGRATQSKTIDLSSADVVANFVFP